ncbi:LysM peptidoglycan-binding domain-containing protein [Anaerobacillus sp. HL2]|nr:LysM peptidoglycan-binding domain-containing protein [Anaerobacillus sp. HL2]
MVQPGDVLGTIAQAHGLKMQDILALNPSITEKHIITNRR